MNFKRRFLALLLAIVMVAGLLPTIGVTALAAEPSIELGYGFNALTGDFTNPSTNGIGRDLILNIDDFDIKTAEPFTRRSNYLYSKEQTELTRTYKNSLTASLNLTIPISVVKMNFDAKFKKENSRSQTSIVSNLWELYYSEVTTKRIGINNLDGVTGAKAHLTSAFAARLSTIKNTQDENRRDSLIDKLFVDYGTHLITSYNKGGRLEITNHVFSNEQKETEQLKETSSLSADIKGGKLVNIEAGVIVSNETDSLSGEKTDTEERSVQVYGGSYSGTINLSASDYKSWQDSLASKATIIGFDQNSLIPVWELTDDSDLSGMIYARYNMHLLGLLSEEADYSFDFGSYIYQSPVLPVNGQLTSEYSVVPFGAANLVAPGSTVYFAMPFKEATISLEGNSSLFAAIDNPTYGTVRFYSNVMDGQPVTLNVSINGTIISSVTFTVAREGICGVNTFAGGYGTAERPYLIATPAQLQQIQYYPMYSYKLIADISLEDFSFVPIDDFYGTFDGNGYSIRNLTITKNESFSLSTDADYNWGMFHVNHGIIKNLYLENCTVQIANLAHLNTGWFAVGALCGKNFGTIERVELIKSEVYAQFGGENNGGDDYTRYVCAGGIVGFNTHYIMNCSVKESKISSYCLGGYPITLVPRTGGIVGISQTEGNRIVNCYSSSNELIAYAGGWARQGGLFEGYAVSTCKVDPSCGSIVGYITHDACVDRCISESVTMTDKGYGHWSNTDTTSHRYEDAKPSCGHHQSGTVERMVVSNCTAIYNFIGIYSDHQYLITEPVNTDTIIQLQTLDPSFIENGWRQDPVTGALYFEGEAQEAPEPSAFPFVKNVTETGIEMLNVPLFEYSLNGIEWTGTANFTGLAPNSTYPVYVRLAQTQSLAASAAKSNPIYVTTTKGTAAAPAAPVEKTVTATSVVLDEIPNGEYSIDGVNWQSSPVFDGLSAGTQYSFYQRISETEQTAASEPSTALVIRTHNPAYHAAKAATCTAEGNTAYYACADCGKYFSDAACTTEILPEAFSLAMLPHTYRNGVCTVCGRPENAMKISAPAVKTSPGKDFTVLVNVANNPGMNALTMKVGYNSSVLTLVSVTDKNLFGARPTTSKTLSANPYNIIWATAGDTAENGELIELVFHVADTAAEGTQIITLTAENAYDENDLAVEVEAENVTVNISLFEPGDANGDGKIDVRDATRILQYLAGWDVTIEDAADANGDDQIDVRDATRLLQYLAGWDVKLGK